MALTSIRHLALAGTVLALGLPGGCGLPEGAPPAHCAAPVPAIPPELQDLAVACLVEGRLEPPFEGLAPSAQDELLELVGRTLHAYGAGSFGSFLALRRRDLDHARRVRSGDVARARSFLRALGADPARTDPDWIATLEAFWRAYYVAPPVGRWLPEATRVSLRQVDRPPDLAAWEQGFERWRDAFDQPFIEGTLVVPHRHSLDEVLRAGPMLRWIDVELGLESPGHESLRLLMRFVHDPAGPEWFLQRAATLYPPRSEVRRHLIL